MTQSHPGRPRLYPEGQRPSKSHATQRIYQARWREKHGITGAHDHGEMVELLAQPEKGNRAEPATNRRLWNLGNGGKWHQALPGQE